MPSERIQRQIDQHLDAAEEAGLRLDWDAAREHAAAALALDAENEDARTLLAAAERRAAAAPGQAPDEPVRPATADGTSPPSPVAATPAFFAGGRYTVKRFLGEGGKKRVYLAHDTTLARDVAFALIKTDGLDSEGRERITREAQAMGKLGTHPHVVSVFDMGSEGESPYLVTELMQGGDIEGLLEQAPEHRLAIPDAVSLAVQVCRGLEFAHSHGLVHRDLKPGNVWLTADGTAKIGDFGLAVSLDRSRLTRAGMMVGTVSYMPPEQAMGGEVSPRSDLYSLGAMLYEMVTGRPPFVGEESVAIITQHLNVPPVSPTWHRPDCPPGLEALILRLLEKDAAKRPASAAEVRQMLEGGLAPATGEVAVQGETAAPHDNPLYRRTFVGREHELRQLQATFDGAVSGNGALVMVVGEPGIGKTALCEQLATYVTVRGGKALVGHCYEEGSLSLPYLPFVEALRSYVLEREPDSLRRELGTGAGEVARIVSEVRDRVEVELPSAGDAEDDRWRLYQAVTGFLRNASAVQPLLIVLEDLHWADRGTLDFLLHLARNLQGARVLITGTYRDVEVDRNHPLSAALAELRRGSNFGRVPLRGLTAEEVQRMLSNLTGQEVRWSLGEAVHRQTEGNPLFIQEVLRYLVEEGIISREDGRWRRSSEEAPEMRLPEGLRDVIGKRLSRLGPDCNALLSVAAVVGREFRLDVLERVAGLPEGTVIAGLQEALRAAVVEEHAQAGATVTYRFTHAFFRQTLYEETIAPQRIRLHQQVARALEEVYARRLEEHAAELAEHFAYSSDPAALSKAVNYGEMAARRAAAVFAYGEAVRLLEHALRVQQVLDPDDRLRRCDLLLALGQMLLAAGESTRADDPVAEEAFLLAEALGDGKRALQACRIGWATGTYGPIGRPGERYDLWARRADERAGDRGPDRADADLLLSIRARAYGDEAGAVRLLFRAWEEAADAFEPQLLLPIATSIMMGTVGPPESHGERLRVARRLPDPLPSSAPVALLGSCLLNLAQVHLTHGDRALAEEVLRRLEALAERSKDAQVLLLPFAGRFALLNLDGRFEEGREVVAQLRNLAAELGRPDSGQALGGRGVRRGLLYQGRYQEALESITSFQSVLASGGVHAGQYAMCLAWAGRVREAQGILDQFWQGRDFSQAGDPTSAAVMRYLLETAVLTGDRRSAEVFGARMAPLAGLTHTEAEMTYCIGRAVGDASRLLGRPAEARGYYQQALEACAKVRFRPEIALTRLHLAELLLEEYPDERPEALQHLDFAIAEFGEMKMQPALERALKHKGLLHA